MSENPNKSTTTKKPGKKERRTASIIVLIALAVLALVLSVLVLIRPTILCNLDYSTLAELLFVFAELLLIFVVIAEGSVAIRELEATREQLRFEAQVRIRDYVREVQSLGFRRPTIWTDFSDQRVCRTHEDQAAMTTYIQLSINSILLLLQAHDCGFLDELEWRNDIKNFLSRKKTIEFWEEHGKFYPEYFQARLKAIRDSCEDPAGN